MRRSHRLLTSLFLVLLSACGGGGSGAGVVAPTYTIGGAVNGLISTTSLTLLNNGTESLTRSNNGAFTFVSSVNSNYVVTVSRHPYWQSCSVANGIGTATTNISNINVTCSTAQAVVSTLAGSGSAGSTDAIGVAASFNAPSGVAVDTNGNVYVADPNNNKIRKISSDGSVSTFAGTGSLGSADGSRLSATFRSPNGVALDSSGNLYIADTSNNKIRKVSTDGNVTTYAGSGVTDSVDANGMSASFFNPWGLAADSNGNLYVADSSNNKIRKITPNRDVSTFAGSGVASSIDGTGSGASFNLPKGVAVDSTGNIYVADGSRKIRKITSAAVVSTLAGSGTYGDNDASGTDATFRSPVGIAVDTLNNIYVADDLSHKIRKITPAGLVTTLAGSGVMGSLDATGTTSTFNRPQGLAIDTNGNIYVGDYDSKKVRKITPTP